MFTNNMHRTV